MTAPGEGMPTGDRAVSPVVGLALLVGIVALGALVVVVLGGSIVQDVNNQNQVEVAEQSMREISSRIDDLENNNRMAFEFPSNLGGDVRTIERTTINLSVGENADVASGGNVCYTGPISIGTLLAETEEGDIIGYEAGGVWRKSSRGSSSVVSPPALNYREGQIGIKLADFDGHMSDSDRLVATVNESGSQLKNEYLQKALLTDKNFEEIEANPGVTPSDITCDPRVLSNMTVSIQNSPFATAWHTYAKRNFSPDRTTIETPDSTVDAGENVSITFTIGERVEPTYVVEDPPALVAYQTNTDSEDFWVNATVNNTGRLTGAQNVTLDWYSKGGGSWTLEASNVTGYRNLSLLNNQNVTLPFRVEHDNLTSGNTYRYSLDTGDQVRNGTVQIVPSTGDLTMFETTITDAPASMQASDSETITAEITNTGTVEATKTVEFTFPDADGSDRTVLESRELTLSAGGTRTLTYDIPTYLQGNLNATFAVDNRRSPAEIDSTDILIGDNEYFGIQGTTPPSGKAVVVGDDFDISTTVKNEGSSGGKQDIELYVRNESGVVVTTETKTKTIPSGSTQTISFDDLEVDEGGVHTYEVVTKNESATGSFTAGDSEAAYFLVQEAGAVPDPVEPEESLNVSALIVNTGVANGSMSYSIAFDGTTISSGTEWLDVDNETVVEGSYEIPSGTSNGTYPVTVSTDNMTLTQDVYVTENVPDSPGIGDDNGTSIGITRNMTISLTVEGTALTGLSDNTQAGYDGSYDIFRSPIEMYVALQNDSNPDGIDRPWGTQDMNTPTKRVLQMQDDPSLNYTTTVGAGTNVSVFAKSYTCGGGEFIRPGNYEDVDIPENGDGYRWIPNPDRGEWGEPNWVTADRLVCTDWVNPWIGISQSQNPSNLVIKKDGERVPGFEAASEDQRSVAEIIENHTTPNGRFDLRENERVLMYELSEADADPDNAYYAGDPDFNDAVVLFRALNTSTDPSAPGDPVLQINDTDAPAKVAPTDTPEVNVTVGNIGTAPDTTNVTLAVDGTVEATESSVNVSEGETKTVSLEAPTMAPGAHTLTINLSANNESVTRSIYVGTSSYDAFVVNVDSSATDTVVEQTDTFTIAAEVTNVGSISGTQDIDFTATPESGTVAVGDSTQTRSGLTLSPGQTKTVQMTFDPDDNTRGRFEVAVSSANTTSTVDVNVEEPRLRIDGAYVGVTKLEPGARTDLDVAPQRLDIVVNNPELIAESGSLSVKLWEGTSPSGAPDIDKSNSVQVRAGADISTVDLDTTLDPGVYAYEISTSDDTESGTLFVPDNARSQASFDTDLISIDANVIALGG
ncbi:CARDB protein [Halorientalis persicus]|uniref:CARDB protein n=1 Tax=Halorientalis persicus TaxID=1367881 RepID=A0A1H8KPJ4_9EURY|nr:CARDB domain-containing protein [Halorientalis persicus]SEN94815.1 CARDB protein [Halorientalis persicus]